MSAPLRMDAVAHETWLLHGTRRSGVRQVTVTADRVVIDTDNGWIVLSHPEELAALSHIIDRTWELFAQAYAEKAVRLGMGARS